MALRKFSASDGNDLGKRSSSCLQRYCPGDRQTVFGSGSVSVVQRQEENDTGSDHLQPQMLQWLTIKLQKCMDVYILQKITVTDEDIVSFTFIVKCFFICKLFRIKTSDKCTHVNVSGCDFLFYFFDMYYQG